MEEAMAPLVVEVLGTSRLRFVKARTETEADTDKQHSIEPEVCNSSPADGIRQEISREDEIWSLAEADMSLGTISDGSKGRVRNRLKYQLIV
ncbi:uncharacterized protein MONOS_14573 [Monocercomonoides exilis]|uniref:uncharacterized protein n=1 Tax=Monocercomonoides exilis TaxID=2049356 RepID=UPI003559CDB7|nr:hypothetical protein MONOS_14573 [Monocercomonoides exilis]|eukprot:MONOS_14573.1-p1 / transcript=MONOS_14573.1 / gene=MONOS_14573 / organism=Monocercomonoides_exilis_PA203 / gene_product=unspecified product / transcript_product=unspecified product / location=Mono_scaffold01026:5188-5463(-) / protein_length=92 / sequence_SO=supercontig / SO=protein_coding / is_pseudo=false